MSTAKKRFGLIAICILMIVAMVLPTAAAASVKTIDVFESGKKNPPTIEQVTLDKKTIGPGETAKFVIYASDHSGKGLDEIIIQLSFYNAIGEVVHFGGYSWTFGTGNTFTLNLSTDEINEISSSAVSVEINVISVTDKTDNTRMYSVNDVKVPILSFGKGVSQKLVIKTDSYKEPASKPAESKTPATTTPDTTKSKDAVTQLNEAVKGGKTSNITIKLAAGKTISANDLKEVKKIAKDKGLTKVYIGFDNKGIRVSVPLAKVKADVLMGGSLSSKAAEAAKTTLAKSYKNELLVVSYDQTEYGSNCKTTINLPEGSKMKTDLVFYSYDTVKGKLTQLKNVDYKVSDKGVLVFVADPSGTVIVSNGKLAK